MIPTANNKKSTAQFGKAFRSKQKRKVQLELKMIFAANKEKRHDQNQL